MGEFIGYQKWDEEGRRITGACVCVCVHAHTHTHTGYQAKDCNEGIKIYNQSKTSPSA